MNTQKRMREVEHGLTVKEIVFLHIEEYRRFPTMYAYARSLAGVRSLPDTVCSRIEQSVLKAHKDRPAEIVNQMVRAAQRDGLFLAKLARECNATIALGERERTLESSLLSALLCLSLHDQGGADERGRLLEWKEKAQVLRERWADALAAVQLIEREYFDGVCLLYPETESDLRTLIDEVTSLMERVDMLLDVQAVGGRRKPPGRARSDQRRVRSRPATATHTRSAARATARRLVMSTKVIILRESRETEQAEKLLDELVAEEV